jgi:hypothetical protein
MSLSQGMTVSLHIGSSVDTTVAANIAAVTGGEYAGAVDAHREFVSRPIMHSQTGYRRLGAH